MEDINLFINTIFNWYKSVFEFIGSQHPVVQALFWMPIASLVVLIFLKFTGKDKVN